jgi:hypothetical protein
VQTVSPKGSVHVSSTVSLPKMTYSYRLVLTSGTSGAHAYLLTGGGRVYMIDLATARLTRHDVPAPPDAALRLASVPNAGNGPQAEPLGDRIVVSEFFQDAGGERKAGLYLIDPATWTGAAARPNRTVMVHDRDGAGHLHVGGNSTVGVVGD